MPREMTPAMRWEKNKLQSTVVWVYLLQVNIAGATGPFRLAAYDQDIIYNGFLFQRYQMQVETLEAPTHAALVQVRVTVENVDQQLQALLETYWVTVASPDWEVIIWEMVPTLPSDTPVGSGERFSVQQASTDLLTSQFDLVAEGLTLSSTVPKRRYTASAGYPNIPRRT